MLKQKLQEELKQSMLARDVLKTSVLRMLLSAINYYEIQKGTELWKRASSPASEAKYRTVPGEADRRGRAGYEATDEDVLSVVQKEAKQHRDSIEQFQKAGRQELVDKETKELELLQKYLPPQMSEEEIKSLVKETIAKTAASSMSDIGKVMGALMLKVKGKTDGAIISKIVKEQLSSPS